MSPFEAGLWVAWECLVGNDPYRNVPKCDFAIRATNRAEVDKARYETRQAWQSRNGGLWPAGDIRLPRDMVRPMIMLPAVSYAPDIVNTSGLYLVSARLRYAMALPDTVCQFLPIELIDGSDLAYEQDYKWMAYLAAEDMVDLDRSHYELDELQPWQIEENRTFRTVDRWVIRDDFAPAGGLFKVARYPGLMMATETLARRFERAGCTGFRFLDLTTYGRPDTARRERQPSGA